MVVVGFVLYRDQLPLELRVILGLLFAVTIGLRLLRYRQFKNFTTTTPFRTPT